MLQAPLRRLSLLASHTAPKMAKPVAIIAGVGPGTGASVAHAFARHYPVVLLARNPSNYTDTVAAINDGPDAAKYNGNKALGLSVDVTSRSSLQETLATVSEKFGFGGKPEDVQVAAAVFNVGGSFARKPFLEQKESDMDAAYLPGVRGAFHFSQLLLPRLLATPASPHPPTLIFTGATASVRGSANFAPFASAKFALRALAQSLAREFGPQGVHVAHVVVDGVIDIPRTKAWDLGEEGKIDPAAIADSYYYLHTQPRTCFTFEIDIRPGKEKW